MRGLLQCVARCLVMKGFTGVWTACRTVCIWMILLRLFARQPDGFCTILKRVVCEKLRKDERLQPCRQLVTLKVYTVTAAWRSRLNPRRGLVIPPVCFYLVSARQSRWSWTLLPACRYCPFDWQLQARPRRPAWRLMMDLLETMRLCEIRPFVTALVCFVSSLDTRVFDNWPCGLTDRRGQKHKLSVMSSHFRRWHETFLHSLTVSGRRSDIVFVV